MEKQLCSRLNSHTPIQHGEMATESKLVSPSRAALFTVTVPSQKFLESSSGRCRFGRVLLSDLPTTQQKHVRTQQMRVDVYEKAV